MCQLIIPLVKKPLQVTADQIIRVEASSNYSCVFFADGKKLLVSKILTWFEERLPSGTFARVHRSHLINTAFIEELVESNSCSLVLRNGDRIELSRRKKSEFINNYKQLLKSDGGII